MRRCPPMLPLVLLLACGQTPPPSPAPVPAPVVDRDGRVTELFCPGSVGCETATGTLLVGAAAEIITPAFERFEDLDLNGSRDDGEPFDDVDGDGEFDPIWMAGFGRGRMANDVHDDIWARAVTLTRGDMRVGIVAVDLIGYFHDDVLDVRHRAREANLGFDHIMIASTHNHEGQDTMGPWGATPFESGRDPVYMELIAARIVAALQRAVAEEVPARLHVGESEAPEMIDDSRDPVVIDPTITAVQFVAESGPTIATIAVFGNHAEALDTEKAITSDYPHYLRERLESAYPGSVALYLPGTLGGLMNPLHIKGCPDADGNETCPAGTFELAEYIGFGVADRIIESLDGSAASMDESFAFKRKRVRLTIGNLAFLTGYVGGIFDRRVFGVDDAPLSRVEAERFTLDEVTDGAVRLQSEVNALTLGPLELVTIPGELYPELWLTGEGGATFIVHNEGADYPDAPEEPPLSSLMPAARMRAVINQGNDALGYIIPKVQYDFVEPYAYDGKRQYGEVNSVGPDIAPQLADGVRRLYGD